MVSVVVACRASKLGCYLASLELRELFCKAIHIHHNLLAEACRRGWLTVSLSEHRYVLPLLGILLQLSYELLHLRVEHLIEGILHSERHRRVVDVLAGESEVDKLLICVKSADAVQFFLYEIFHCLDVMVGDLLYVLHSLGIVL